MVGSGLVTQQSAVMQTFCEAKSIDFLWPWTVFPGGHNEILKGHCLSLWLMQITNGYKAHWKCLVYWRGLITKLFFIFIFFKILFICREKGREGEMERNIDVRETHWLVASCVTPTGDLARNPGLCPDWESNRQPFFWFTSWHWILWATPARALSYFLKILVGKQIWLHLSKLPQQLDNQGENM